MEPSSKPENQPFDPSILRPDLAQAPLSTGSAQDKQTRKPLPKRPALWISLLFLVIIIGLGLWGWLHPALQPLMAIDIPFTGESVMGDMQGEPYRYFRYDSEEATRADVAKISKDGRWIGWRLMPWEGPVHFYYLRERIVIYVGDKPEVLELIEKIFGPQVAGD